MLSGNAAVHVATRSACNKIKTNSRNNNLGEIVKPEWTSSRLIEKKTMTSALCHLWHKRELNTCLASISVNIISSSCSIRSLKCIRQEIHRRNMFVMSHCLELSFECMSLCRCMEICHKQDQVFFFNQAMRSMRKEEKLCGHVFQHCWGFRFYIMAPQLCP